MAEPLVGSQQFPEAVIHSMLDFPDIGVVITSCILQGFTANSV
ncbi:hypothetical protein [Dyadobacter aurulentus]|nr:hypothetical protein [Dyadobacter sp. UC 10]